jgi:hypothetical protein
MRVRVAQTAEGRWRACTQSTREVAAPSVLGPRFERRLTCAPVRTELLGSWWGECGRLTANDVLVFPGESASGHLSGSNLLRRHLTPGWRGRASPDSGRQAGMAEEEADDGTSKANSLGCASQQDSRKGARRGREEASKVACPDREEGASKAQATEEDLARQVDKSSTGRSPGAADRRLWQKRLSPSGAGRCVFASGILPCSVSLRLPVAARLGTSRRFRD